jgi:cell division protein FtsW
MKNHFNYLLFFLVLTLFGFGLIFLACLSSQASLQRFGHTNYYFFHQLVLSVVAIALAFAAYKVPLHIIKKWAPLLVIINLGALFLVFLPQIGSKFWGATRWLTFAGFTFQPSEFFKLTAILYLSAWISSKLSEANVVGWKSLAQKGYHNIIYIFLPFAIFLGLVLTALYFQRDATTLGIISITLLAIYFSARTPLWHTILIIALGLIVLLVMVKFEPYRLDRWLVFLNPDHDPMGKGFQLKQSLISIGSGGFLGKGLGMSTQKFGFLPQAMSDSVFAIIGEELGILGSVIVIISFCWFFWLGIKIAKNSSDKFSKLVATGISVWITLQAFVNIGSSIGIFPLTGVPLPFFSYGGSHLITELIGIGILLNISKNT